MHKTKSLLILMVWAGIANAKPAPPFHGELMTGERVSLSQYVKPGRALLLCFWATWCVPCMEELQQVKDHLKAMPALALDMVAVNVDTSETSADVKPTARQRKYDFPIIMDPKQEIFSKYQRENSLPFSALIDAKGDIVETFNGFQEGMFAKVETLIKAADAKP